MEDNKSFSTTSDVEFYSAQKEVIKRSVANCSTIPGKQLGVDEYCKLLNLYFELDDKERRAITTQKTMEMLEIIKHSGAHENK